MSLDDPFTDGSPFAAGTRALFGAAGWCWVLAILGALDRRRSARRAASREPGTARRARAYLVVAALPLYVLHQPVLVAVAYGVIGWDTPAPVKYAVIVAGTLAVILLLYEYGVRRTAAGRVLFGMRTAAAPR
ncbi:hypothetical protein GCM10020256_72040 [Streptomyces thermocoprophilus]